MSWISLGAARAFQQGELGQGGGSLAGSLFVEGPSEVSGRFRVSSRSVKAQKALLQRRKLKVAEKFKQWEGIRQRQLQTAQKRRTDLAGAEFVDREAVLRALRPSRATKNHTPYDWGCAHAVVAGAVTTQVHLHRAGRVANDTCPYCGQQVPETLEHMYCLCPA